MKKIKVRNHLKEMRPMKRRMRNFFEEDALTSQKIFNEEGEKQEWC